MLTRIATSSRWVTKTASAALAALLLCAAFSAQSVEAKPKDMCSTWLRNAVYWYVHGDSELAAGYLDIYDAYGC